jgi:hypothetical protein
MGKGKNGKGKGKRKVVEVVVVKKPKKVKGEKKKSRQNNSKSVKRLVKLPKFSDDQSAACRVMSCIMNPSGSQVRFASDGGGIPTSLIDLHIAKNFATASSYVGTYVNMLPGQLQIFLFRSPLRSLVVSTPNVSAYTYSAVFPSGPTLAVVTSSTAQITPLYLSAVSTGQSPHGSQLFCGACDGDTYFWADPGVTITTSRVITGSVDTMYTYMFDPDGDDPLVNQVTYGSGDTTKSYTVSTVSSSITSNGGYFRVLYTNGSTTVTAQISLSIGTTVASDVMAHLSMPRMVEHIPQLTACRVNACNMLLSNAASLTAQNGFIQGANVNEGTPWYKLIGKDSYTDMTNGERFYYDRPFKHGLYTYLAPSQLEDLQFEHMATYDDVAKVATSLHFELMKDRYVVAVMDVSKDGNGTFSGLTFVLNCSYVLEFQTNDPWYEVASANNFPDQVARGIAMVGRMKYFFENPTHLQKLASMARGAGMLLRKHAGKIGGALSALFPAYSGVFGTLAGALSD